MAKKLPDKHVRVPVEELIIKRMAQTREKKAKDDGESSGFKGPSIHKVPDSLRQGNHNAYEPALISIGPLHRSKDNLTAMDDHKLKYLGDLINREPKMNVKAFVDAVWPHEQRARREYSVPINLEPDPFVEMLVLDGCFVVEFFIKRATGNVGSPWVYAKWNLPMLRNDMLLLENQIPFFILKALFDVRYPNGLTRQNSTATLSIMDLALHYIDTRDMLEEELEEGRIKVKEHESIHHLLHLHYLCQLIDFKFEQTTEPRREVAPEISPSPGFYWNRFWKIAYQHCVSCFYFLLSLVLMCKRPRRRSFERGNAPRTIPSVTNLREAGVKFKRQDRTKCYLNVSFSEENGKLKIPHLSLQQSTVSSFRNLIAFEQCCPGIDSSKTYLTAYAIFMDKIIDTSEDVAVLVKHGIIESKLGTDEDVANLFNNICKGASLSYKKQYLVELFKQVNRYCDSDQHRWRAALVNIYFHNPWAAVSVIAALVLLLLTLGGTVASFVQTVYTVKAYKNPGNSS